jgi:hypothetical protein
MNPADSKKDKNMADTFSQIYIQIVFAVKGRENIIFGLTEEEKQIVEGE